ncbi:uncharacterized protein BDR25DRAFT_355202 [Lindgomyces ingoldianus]|uniref:Uncharacterized protein n=1 Tax=Lindgomyces ingoldianus TaxID=673940 RepID=A0ACB6QUS0_9PLEO|nr:uncharacterized protein BDR25DRAFT_355202 [Lindgomyces ingoldianus]KAF2470744.1 hypothetical protein BDR25DRAFT_355202 [Lindgomyces ingoldianus]
MPPLRSNLTTLKTQKYLNTLNETITNYTTIMVRDLDDQDSTYAWATSWETVRFHC